ncbi:MAG: chromosome segregation protein SMC [Erysipelotrichaceae bacterium]|nr:chromosome segregation protein SMC [Erysipelotrichaceae bacterium]
MFLKRIELQGFKSFADHTVITFDNPYTGIVGPNGCGKSNISDAIRWVLGEQSARNMRGQTMTDVVFAGAEGKRGVNLAEVTLVFDNSKKYLNTDYEEVEITRRLFKNTNESEYLINRTPCRLKDIVDLTLDTGLGKDSLSIISQGNIASFAEAKPIERRGLFEEAAGVAKYKKRKMESLSKLERTQNNIDNLNLVVNELEKQVAPLRRQARKAQQYQQKKDRLTEIEVAVLVNDIRNYLSDLDTTDKQLEDLNFQGTTTKASITILENDLDNLKNEIKNLDNSVQSQQDELLRIINEIQTLEHRKVEVDEKRKYIRESGTDEAKIQQTKLLLDEAKFEYDDRQKRYDQLETDISLITDRIEGYNNDLSDKQDKLDNLSSSLNYLNNRKSVLVAQQQAPLQGHAGVKSIMEARNALPGICGTVSDLFKPDDGYQQAISVALGGAVYHIITVDDSAARNAIRYLKNNHSGRATFLPMNIMQPRYVNKDHLFIAEHTNGFLGLASDFVDCEEKYDGVLLSLLGNTMICDTLDNASRLSARLKQGYNIVTLDGDTIHRGGSISGGYNRKQETPMTLNSLIDDITRQIADTQLSIESLQADFNKVKRLKDEDEDNVINLKIQLATLQQVLAVKRSKYESLQEEYDRIKIDENEEGESFVDELIEKLNNRYKLRDETSNDISTKRSRRINLSADEQRKEIQLRQKRQEDTLIGMKYNNAKIEKTRLETLRDNQIERLSREYHMTYEFASSKQYDVDLDEAKQEVLNLRSEIASLGNVNLDAPKDYEEVNGRYEFMVSQLDDLQSSRDKLLQAINDLDDVMTKKFMEVFEKINSSLNEVFTVLFGGGRAKLVLENPDDILNTGIDINAQPPGKNIQNIRLFSGGEKSLIAICVLFAILKARTMPLCIFDEVEASLDQGNVDRFARYIHKFSDESQFIVITHRPGTMTECDVLYGITMPQKGVSKVIQVKLKEALSYAEEGAENGTVR